MQVEGIEAVVVPLSLKDPVVSAGLTHSDKTTLFIRVSTDEGVGWGECSAYPGARPPDPTVTSVEPDLVDGAVARLFAASPNGVLPPAHRVASSCVVEGSVAGQAVAAALEMGVFDAELRSSGRSLAGSLGASGTVETGSVVGIPIDRDVGELLRAVGSALDDGSRRIRLKIEPGWALTPVAAVRESFPDARVQGDANGSFGPGDLSELRQLDEFGLACLEQPFPAGDLAAHRRLAEAMETPIALDESLDSPRAVRAALAASACEVACLKPGRLGGVAATLAASRACAEAGIACFIGGFFESGLARSVNAALAGRPEFGLPGDLGDPDRYLVGNPFSYLRVERGLVVLSEAPGLGAEPRPGALEAATSRRWLPYRA